MRAHYGGWRVERRRQAILATGGTLTGAYPPGHLAALRADWPA
jgi:hypothetical protein